MFFLGSTRGYVLKSMWLLLLGLIRLRSNPPPKLQGLEYVLNITATDDNASGGPQSLSSMAQVIVGVDDVNNNKPIFEKVLNVCLLLESSINVHSFVFSSIKNDEWFGNLIVALHSKPSKETFFQ